MRERMRETEKERGREQQLEEKKSQRGSHRIFDVSNKGLEPTIVCIIRSGYVGWYDSFWTERVFWSQLAHEVKGTERIECSV